MSVTIRDVARLADVSVATVSRVLNASAAVQPATRSRVLAAARQLRFSPNGAARSLITQRTHAVGVILPDLYGEFFSELLRGMDQAAQLRAHHLLVSSSHHEQRGIEAAARAMRGRVDGLLVMAPDVGSPVLAAALPAALPTVLLNGPEVRGADDADLRALTVDNRGGAEAMTNHLLAIGHRRIAFIAGAAHNADAAERELGHRAALRAAGVPHDRALYVRGNFTEEGGWEAAVQLLELDDRPTVLFAANDAMAIGALSALRERGVRVPEDMAVVGFDDIPVARYLNPPLTSVRVGIAQLGERAVTLLLDALAERSPPGVVRRREVIPVALVVRASCGSPPDAPPAARAARRP